MLRVVDPKILKQRNFRAGLITLTLIAVGTFFGFTRYNPLASPFELRAAFDDIVTLKPGAQVRIAGIKVGKVSAVDAPADGRRGAIVTMKIEDRGLPVHRDAELKIRPRIFLEGNMFVDLEPGRPGVPELGDGDVVPATQTSAPVGFGQVLTALQGSTRQDLQVVLDEYGRALSGRGARGVNRSSQYWEGAYRDGAIVNDALRGQDPHDLSGYIESAGAVAEALDRDPAALKSLVTNFAITADAFAIEQQNLRAAIAVLPQTLQRGHRALGALNDAFPAARRLVAALRPAVRSSGPALDAQPPLLRELRGLLSAREMGGLSRDMRRVVPDLVHMARGGVKLQTQARRLSSCQLNSVIPTADAKIDDPDFVPSGPVYEEGVKWMPGIAGESRNFDGNGQYVKTTVRGGFNFAYQLGDGNVRLTSRELLGVNPPKMAMPPLRPDVACETQDAPLLDSKPGAPPAAIKIATSGERYEQRFAKAQQRAVTWLRGQLKYEGLDKVVKVVSDVLQASELPKLKAGR